jgi:preprotein translocase subunit SecE
MGKKILKYTIIGVIIFSMIFAVFAGLISAAMSA